jgi:hypothetical protein
VNVLISCNGPISIFDCGTGYAGIEHLYFHARKGVQIFCVHSPLPEGLKSFGMTHDDPYVDEKESTVLELPEELPNTLIKLNIIGCVGNGVTDELKVAELPANLLFFEWIGIHADDQFFMHSVPLNLEEIKIVSGDYDSLYLSEYLSVRLEKLQKLTLVAIRNNIDCFDVDLKQYPSLTHLMFNDGTPDNINFKKNP